MAIEPYTLQSQALPGIYLASKMELSHDWDWVIPPLLLKSMAEGEPLIFSESISSQLFSSLDVLQTIYRSWDKRLRKVDITAVCTERSASSGVSCFFSGGVDSLYTLTQHASEIQNLILIHGFDIPLGDEGAFELAAAQAQRAAYYFGKKLLIVRTNLRWAEPANLPGGWSMFHGALLVSCAHALSPHHSKVYIASSYSYAALHPWGSHPILDPLWSSEAVQIIHDTCDTRVGKLALLAESPEVLSMMRVCWQNQGTANCGVCEKCLRTMIALKGLGIENCSAFPDTLTPKRVRIQELSADSLLFWRELLLLDLPDNLREAVSVAISSAEKKLPPRNGTIRRNVRRSLVAMAHIREILRELI